MPAPKAKTDKTLNIIVLRLDVETRRDIDSIFRSTINKVATASIYKRGLLIAEGVEAIFKLGTPVTSSERGMERPSTSAMHDLICAIIEDDATYDATTNTWDTSKAATAIIAAFDGTSTAASTEAAHS